MDSRNNIKVSVVVVTFNRLTLLKNCLNSIAGQTFPINEVIVVNNNSTDGTNEWLATQSNFRVIEQENSGSAGGFHTGIKMAYDGGADWIWIMDDDVEAAPTCLEYLLKYREHSDCLHPNKFANDGSEYTWEGYFDPISGIDFDVQNVSFKNNKEICFVNKGCFEGMLLKSSLVQKIGFPDKRFFIVYDDVMYGLMASFYTNVAYIKSATMYNKKPLGTIHHSDMYLYYYIRNRHLVEEYIDKHFPNTNKRTRNIIFRLFVLKKLLIFPFASRKGIRAKLKTTRVVFRAYLDYKAKKTFKSF